MRSHGGLKTPPSGHWPSRKGRSIPRCIEWKNAGGSTRSGAYRSSAGVPSSIASRARAVSSWPAIPRHGRLSPRRSIRCCCPAPQAGRASRPQRAEHVMKIRQRLRSALWRVPVEDEVRDELTHHLDLRTEELVERGMDRTEARAEAIRQIGRPAG